MSMFFGMGHFHPPNTTHLVIPFVEDGPLDLAQGKVVKKWETHVLLAWAHLEDGVEVRMSRMLDGEEKTLETFTAEKKYEVAWLKKGEEVTFHIEGAFDALADGVAAVFADLNRGADVTKGLRKVDKSEMTHKNPALRAGNVVPASSGAGAKKPVKPTKPQALMGKKPAKFALEGNKWIIEYQENESALEVANADITQVINLFACKNTTVIIKGKVNAVTLVNCTKTSVLVESVVSSVSITKSPSFALQITGVAPTIQIDSTDSGQIYLSKQCLGVEITTAKCSAVNVSLPVEGEEDGVFEEQAVPEMLKTVVQNGKLVTTIVEHAG